MKRKKLAELSASEDAGPDFDIDRWMAEKSVESAQQEFTEGAAAYGKDVALRLFNWRVSHWSNQFTNYSLRRSFYVLGTFMDGETHSFRVCYDALRKKYHEVYHKTISENTLIAHHQIGEDAGIITITREKWAKGHGYPHMNRSNVYTVNFGLVLRGIDTVPYIFTSCPPLDEAKLLASCGKDCGKDCGHTYSYTYSPTVAAPVAGAGASASPSRAGKKTSPGKTARSKRAAPSPGDAAQRPGPHDDVWPLEETESLVEALGPVQAKTDLLHPVLADAAARHGADTVRSSVLGFDMSRVRNPGGFIYSKLESVIIPEWTPASDKVPDGAENMPQGKAHRHMPQCRCSNRPPWATGKKVHYHRMECRCLTPDRCPECGLDTSESKDHPRSSRCRYGWVTIRLQEADESKKLACPGCGMQPSNGIFAHGKGCPLACPGCECTTDPALLAYEGRDDPYHSWCDLTGR